MTWEGNLYMPLRTNGKVSYMILQMLTLLLMMVELCLGWQPMYVLLRWYESNKCVQPIWNNCCCYIYSWDALYYAVLWYIFGCPGTNSKLSTTLAAVYTDKTTLRRVVSMYMDIAGCKIQKSVLMAMSTTRSIESIYPSWILRPGYGSWCWLSIWVTLLILQGAQTMVPMEALASRVKFGL